MRLSAVLVVILMCLLWANNSFSENVYVTNFPEVQITQDVEPRTDLAVIERINVGTFTTKEVMTLSSKYILDTKGYAKATLSLFGFPKAREFADCRVGVILLPDQAAIWKAWEEDRATILVRELGVNVYKDEKYFQGQGEIDINFPSYMVGFYNTCNTNIEVSLYSYLKSP